MALPLLNVGVRDTKGEIYQSVRERSLPMAGGPTPPPEEDLAHSCLPVKGEVSVNRQAFTVRETDFKL